MKIKSGKIPDPNSYDMDKYNSALFCQAKHNKLDEARVLRYLKKRHDNIEKNDYSMLDQNMIRTIVAKYMYRSKLNLKDRYHNIRINPDHEKYIAFIILFGQYMTGVMQ